MERKIVTSHSRLAAMIRERRAAGRYATLADAVRAHEARFSSRGIAQRPQDSDLYGSLRRIGDRRAA